MTEDPTALLCSSCGTELHGQRWNWMCCQPCEDWIRDQLNTVEHLWQTLPEHLEHRARGARPSIGERLVRAVPSGRLPLSEDVLSLLCGGGVVDRLERHDAVIRIARGGTGHPPQGTTDARLGAAIRSLRNHLPWAAEHVDLWDLANELRALVGELRHATGEKPDRVDTRTPCPQDTDDGSPCPGILVYDRARRTAQCDTCNTPIDPARWLALAARLDAA